MKYVILVMLFVTNLSASTFPLISAKNFNVDFKDKVGSGFVDFLKYKPGDHIGLTHKSLQFILKKQVDRFVLADNTHQIDFFYELTFLDNFPGFKLEGLNVESHDNTFVVEFNKSVFETPKFDYTLNTFGFNCIGQRINSEGPDPIAACQNEANLTLKNILFLDTAPLAQIFQNTIESTQNLTEKKFKPFKVNGLKDVEMKVKNTKLSSKVLIDTLVDIPFTIDGNVLYEQEKSRFAIKVDSVKVWILPVTKIFLEQMKKIKINEVKVEPPYIYIYTGSSFKKKLK